MIVYVESNFIIELALAQEQARFAKEILRSARNKKIDLAIPSFALAESASALRQKILDSQKLLEQVEHQLGQARRSGFSLASER